MDKQLNAGKEFRNDQIYRIGHFKRPNGNPGSVLFWIISWKLSLVTDFLLREFAKISLVISFQSLQLIERATKVSDSNFYRKTVEKLVRREKHFPSCFIYLLGTNLTTSYICLVILVSLKKQWDLTKIWLLSYIKATASLLVVYVG